MKKVIPPIALFLLVFIIILGSYYLGGYRLDPLTAAKAYLDDGDDAVSNGLEDYDRDKVYSDFKTTVITYEELVKKVESKEIEPRDLSDLYIIEKNKIDLNKDDIKEEIIFAAFPLNNAPDYFWQPAYLIFTDPVTKKLKKVKLDFPPIDLTKNNVKIRYADINEDEVPEIFYSVDYPQPEHVERWPHLLIYEPKQGTFNDVDIASVYEYLVADWGIEKDKKGRDTLWLSIKKDPYDEKPMKSNFVLLKDKLTVKKL